MALCLDELAGYLATLAFLLGVSSLLASLAWPACLAWRRRRWVTSLRQVSGRGAPCTFR